jgi:cytochrome P450
VDRAKFYEIIGNAALKFFDSALNVLTGLDNPMGATNSQLTTDLEERFDPFTEPYLADPYLFFAEARTVTPVFYSRKLDYWVVTRYRDIRDILPNNKQFSVAEALSVVRPICPEGIQFFSAAGFDALPTLANNDPPSHTRIRRLANFALTATRLAEIESFIRETTVRCVTERFDSRRADLVRDLTFDLPALVIFRLLGIPDEDAPLLKPTLEARILPFWGRSSEDEQLRVAQWMAKSWAYTKQFVAARARVPRNDFTSALLQARLPDLVPLSEHEVRSLVFGLLVAAHETTTSLLTNGFRRLLADRHSWEAIYHDPALITNAIEEILRMDTSIIAWRRKTKEPVEIAGRLVPANATLLLLLGSANRDPEVFEEPDTFSIRRPNAKDHLSFGYGPHFCLGAFLARLEARVVFEEVSSRLPTLRLLAGQEVRFLPNTFFRAPLSLLVEWTAR